MTPVVIVIGGPTASGKTALSIDLALALQTEIINADSRQVYKELNIGVARPTEKELNTAVHHFVASHSIHQPLNAGSYAREAMAQLNKVLLHKNIAIVSGGTGLYIQALLDGLDDMPKIGTETRNFVNQLYLNEGLTALLAALSSADADALAQIDVQNPARVKRALELVMASGKKLRELRPKKDPIQHPFQILRYYLNPKRDVLYTSINKRCLAMLDAGFVDEVQGLVDFQTLQALQTVGYKECFDFLNGNTSHSNFISLFQQHTRNYAKRQLTWFKNHSEYKPLITDNALDTIFEDLKSHGYQFHS